MAEGGGLLNRYTDLNPYQGFESPPLRQFFSRTHSPASDHKRNLPGGRAFNEKSSERPIHKPVKKLKCDPSVNRENRNTDGSTIGLRPVTRSAMSRPTPGPMPKP